ncbi:MAG TPA: 16S rRNA (guanine(966)-N(2))-methyltransferase RsmD [Elusimicrobia bacterium]|nr:MAG: 16S rRNA (guanine(966)-N(2))-methyltransferase RsmD [Elusimicrobia bacterium GWF2_62_30]HBA61527.1 16S rRNA (guanine(966)-N(2))-methyltransferase RsmD [Elusimicrobiota bacterium]
MMRIIAGTRGSRKIYSVPKDKFVKPISARIRQSLFDILRPYVTGATFLDLYAGVGTVGLEALSRGASKAVFVEKDGQCLKVIERNIEALDFKEQAKALKADVLSGLKWLEHYSDYKGYDIVFMGPPYRTDENLPLFYSMETLELLAASGIAAPNAVIVLQHHNKEEVTAPAGLEMTRREKYGDSFVDFFRLKK